MKGFSCSLGVDVIEPLKKCRGMVEEAFGSSKQIGWWLEYTMNHDPGYYWVSNLLWPLLSVMHAYSL